MDVKTNYGDLNMSAMLRCCIVDAATAIWVTWLTVEQQVRSGLTGPNCTTPTQT